MFGRLLRHIKQSIPGGHPFLAFNPVIKSDHPETVCSVQTHGPYLGEEQGYDACGERVRVTLSANPT